MQLIKTREDLKNAILELEFRQAADLESFKEEFTCTCERLSPMNLLKRTFSIDGALGLAAGYLSQKIFVGSSKNPIRKLVGYAVEFGIADLVTKNPEAIKSIGSGILRKIFSRKE